MPIIQVTDQHDLVETTSIPHGKWKWDKFNPVQSRVVEFYDKDANALISSATSSGKTTMAELLAIHDTRKNKKKVIYTAPLRALAQEKIDDWSDPEHHFYDLKKCILTGDYKLTEARKKELEEADIIIMTNEMLSHRCRHYKSEKNNFLNDVGLLICDEGHLISSKNRGVHFEVGLMAFTKINPDCRILLLSATMPNVDELAEWISNLNNKDTYVLKSTFRPTKLNIHFEAYCDDFKYYDDLEKEKVNKALDIVEYYPDDKFLLFVHTKKTGEILKKELTSIGIKSEFHNADLNKDSRTKLEKKFKEDKNFRVIIATSSLSTGVNLPARRVVILGITRGLEEVESSEVSQQCGRAGRVGLDPAGDAYILLPKSKIDLLKEKYKKINPIKSRLLDVIGNQYKDLAFHLISEIYYKNVSTLEDIHTWFKRSFAFYQNHQLDDDLIDTTVDLLKKCGAVWEEDETYTATNIGKIASLFYFSPFDVSDLKKNFTLLFSESKQDDDLWVSLCLGNTDTQRMNIISKSEKAEISMYVNRIRNSVGARLFSNDSSLKAGYCYSAILNGFHSACMGAIQRNFQMDYDRMHQVLKALDSMAGKWNQGAFFETLQKRIRHGVKPELLDLCSIPGVGKVRADKLYKKGVKTPQDFTKKSIGELKILLNLKEDTVKEMMEYCSKNQ